MKTLEDFEIGEEVTYFPVHAKFDPTHKDVENGIVSSKNDKYIFVRYYRFGALMNTGENTPIECLKKGHYKPDTFDDDDPIS